MQLQFHAGQMAGRRERRMRDAPVLQSLDTRRPVYTALYRERQWTHRKSDLDSMTALAE